MNSLRKFFICVLGLMLFMVLNCTEVSANSDYDIGQSTSTLGKYQSITNRPKLTESSGSGYVGNLSLNQNDKSIHYQIEQKIPAEWAQYYYKQVKTTAMLPGRIKEIKVKNELGKDVTNFFTNHSSNNKLDLEAQSSTLKNDSFYDHTYYIDVKTDSPKDTDKVDTFNTRVKSNIDGITKDSNSVSLALFNKHSVRVHYLKKGTTKKVAVDKVLLVSDGTKYFTNAKKITGYTATKKSQNIKYTGKSDFNFWYIPNIEKVVVKYMYDESKNDFEEYDQKVITGYFGEKYSAKPIDLLNDAGYWILDTNKLPKNATGTFNERNKLVYFFYKSDHDREIEHKDGSDTYIDITADNRVGVINENFADGVEMEIERDDFDQKQYTVTLFNADDDPVKEIKVDFGTSPQVIKIGDSYYQIIVGNDGSVKVTRISSGKKVVTETFFVSGDGKKETSHTTKLKYLGNQKTIQQIKPYLAKQYGEGDLTKVFNSLTNPKYASVEAAVAANPEVLGLVHVRKHIQSELKNGQRGRATKLVNASKQNGNSNGIKKTSSAKPAGSQKNTGIIPQLSENKTNILTVLGLALLIMLVYILRLRGNLKNRR